ncbi:hypothetical protein ACFQ7Z_20520 [Streptomyces virginiae]|uniref:hypothetical protein n=1 Tax=Streptomyces virginiae TaxID=1961 RepID=UPI00369C0B50
MCHPRLHDRTGVDLSPAAVDRARLPGLGLPAQDVVEYPHSMGEIVTAAATAGLTVKHLGEHVAAQFAPRGILPRAPERPTA